MGISTSKDVFEQLSKVIDLPNNSRQIVIRLGYNEAPTVEATFFIGAENPKERTEVTKRFMIVEIEESEHHETNQTEHSEQTEVVIQ